MNSNKPKITPALPRGMRDLLPDQLAVRYKVIETLRRVFELYGFQPLETPAMERLEILSGKGGEESDKLSFLVMKRGEELQRALEKVKAGDLSGSDAARELADMGLRYDLTVPLARVAAMYQGKLPMPFKRYQIAPVWRAERPQHGRYREFTQCDVDIVGTVSPKADAEIINLFSDGFASLGIEVEVHVNDREILKRISRACGNSDSQFPEFTTALDKVDKIGTDGVSAEMAKRGLCLSALSELWNFLEFKPLLTRSTIPEIESQISKFVGSDILRELYMGLIPVLNKVLDLGGSKIEKIVRFNPALARGLDYYTGTIFEAVALNATIGSLGGGGRYDGLVGTFSKNNESAVGTSFGLDRILDVLVTQGRVPETQSRATVVVSRNISNEFTQPKGNLPLIGRIEGGVLRCLHRNSISCEPHYYDTNRLEQQLKTAVYMNAQFVLILDDESIEEYRAVNDEGIFDDTRFKAKIRRLVDRKQLTLTLPQIIEWVKESK